MGLKYVSVHGHFYQPPREDPLTGSIPIERGASPYANWNERILAECYRPNAELGNFQKISFNIGPTLAAWIKSFEPQVARMIAAQDAANVQRHGVGNAMAQAYNHTILPLASRHDQATQVAWGIADFAHRFGRKPQGMWLPETAVDMDTLETLAAQGIEFTILAPWQAAQDNPDVTEPYRVRLSGGRSIQVFFYQRELSGRISFDPGATVNADDFAANLLQPHYNSEKVLRGEPQIVLLASDGELYGHHQHLRDYFLARLMDGASSGIGIEPTFPALWLKENPPRQWMEIREQTSWSCHHGVTRWMGSCGCTPGDASWKAQMRYSFERIAGEVDRIYLNAVKPMISDPWALRDRYIHVILGRIGAGELIEEMAGGALQTPQVERIRLLLEAQRERQRMFTSCGWFFEDFDRIEPRNNVAYAAQAVNLVRQATGIDLETYALADLDRVISQRSGLRASQVFSAHLHEGGSTVTRTLPDLGALQAGIN